MEQVRRRNLIFRYSKISSLTILGYWVKVETRVFDLFDLFFEDRIVDRKLINILSINFPKLPNREKENLEYPILQRMLHFRRKKKKKRKKEKNRCNSIYLPFTMVLVKMLSPKLSCTAKLSPCMYCRDAHPGTEWKDIPWNDCSRSSLLDGHTGRISVTWHLFIVSFRRLLCFLVAAFYYVQLNHTMLPTWSL